MPTLLQINVDANNGSNGAIARDLGSLVMKNGWESYIAYGRDSVPSTSRLIRIGGKLNVLFHVAISRIFDNHGLLSTVATKRFIRQIKSINPDIIHLHNIHGYYINYRVLFDYLRESGIPVVWTLHDCWPYTGHCSHFISAKCNRWKEGCHHCPLKSHYPKSILFDLSARNYQIKKTVFTSLPKMVITTVSQWMGEQASCSFLNKYPIHVIKNGIDTAVFRYSPGVVRERYKITAKFLLIGVAANWSQSKGLFDYYELQKSLNQDYQIVLIGLTPSQIDALPEGIIGIKRTENLQELVQLYSAADVVLNLSYAESFGLTTIEGMACGTPGIVYDNTASPELVTSETGIIVPTGNIEFVAKAVNDITAKGKDYYKENCQKRAHQHFDKDVIYSQYFQLYCNLLRNN